MPTKICTKCKIEKNVVEFYKIKGGLFGVHASCKCCMKQYQSDRVGKNGNCKEKHLEIMKRYYENNKSTIKLVYERQKSNPIYKARNIKAGIKYESKMIEKNPLFKMKKLIRSNIRQAFLRYSKYGKANTCKEYGIDFADIYNHVGPRPDSSYHLDHIIPISFFDLDISEHVRLAHIPQNLRWIPGKENLEKSDSIDFECVLKSAELQMICQILGIDYTSQIQKVA